MGGQDILKYYYSEWTQLGGKIHGQTNEDYFGRQVKLNSTGNILIASGDYADTINGTNSGLCRIFEYKALIPIEVLRSPVVFEYKAPDPRAALYCPVVFEYKER